MKSILTSLAFFVVISIFYNETPSIDRTTEEVTFKLTSDPTNRIIEDGWHTSTVTYSNLKKIVSHTSELNVFVQNNQVIKLDLGNGEILEDGKTLSGYLYSGGIINPKYDEETQKNILKASVKIKESNGAMSFYEIVIQ